MRQKLEALIMAMAICLCLIAPVKALDGEPDGDYNKHNLFVTTCSLTIRDKPNNSGKIVGYYRPNTGIVSLSESGKWIKTNKGYVFSGFCAECAAGYFETVLIATDTKVYADNRCKDKGVEIAAATEVLITGDRIKVNGKWMVPIEWNGNHYFSRYDNLCFIGGVKPFYVTAKKNTTLYPTPKIKKNGVKCRKGAKLKVLRKVSGRYQAATNDGGTLIFKYVPAADVRR